MLYGDSGIAIDIEDSLECHRFVNKRITNFKRPTSKLVGGYICCGGFGPAISFAIHPAPGTKSRTAVPMMQDLKAAEKSSPSEEATSSGNLYALSISSPQAKRDRLIQKNSSPGMWINIGSVTPDADKVVIRETVSGGALACRVPRPPEGLAIGGTIGPIMAGEAKILRNAEGENTEDDVFKVSWKYEGFGNTLDKAANGKSTGSQSAEAMPSSNSEPLSSWIPGRLTSSIASITIAVVALLLVRVRVVIFMILVISIIAAMSKKFRHWWQQDARPREAPQVRWSLMIGDPARQTPYKSSSAKESARRRRHDVASSPAQELFPVSDGGESDANETLATDEVQKLHLAGSTMTYIADEAKANQGKHAWAKCSASTFRLRVGPNYRRTGRKEPSGISLYEPIASDLHRSGKKLINVGRYLKFSQPDVDLIKSRADLAAKLGVNLPIVFILHWEMPQYPPPNPLWGEKRDDGPNFSLCICFVISEWVLRSPQKNSVDLWSRFCSKEATAQFRERAKIIVSLRNPQQCQLSTLETALHNKYNMKPFLSRPQHLFIHEKFSRKSGLHRVPCFEMMVDAHRFAYLPRSTGAAVVHRAHNFVMDLGVTVEAREDSEMPEQILACVKLSRMNFKGMPEWNDASKDVMDMK